MPSRCRKTPGPAENIPRPKRPSLSPRNSSNMPGAQREQDVTAKTNKQIKRTQAKHKIKKSEGGREE